MLCVKIKSVMAHGPWVMERPERFRLNHQSKPEIPYDRVQRLQTSFS